MGILLLALSIATPARADPPALPGIGAVDRRVAVDAAQAPWSSLVKVQTNLATKCTGVLVAPRRIVTAAHCLFNRRTGAFLQPVSLHVLFGYARGAWTAHAAVQAVARDPAYDPTRPTVTLAADWAVLTLAADAPPGAVPLPLAPEVGAGTAAALAGYSQDRAQILTADAACAIRGAADTPAGPVLVHDCMGTRGTSGAALLARGAQGWAVAGIAVAAGGGGDPRSLAVPARRFAGALP